MKFLFDEKILMETISQNHFLTTVLLRERNIVGNMAHSVVLQPEFLQLLFINSLEEIIITTNSFTCPSWPFSKKKMSNKTTGTVGQLQCFSNASVFLHIYEDSPRTKFFNLAYLNSLSSTKEPYR